MTATMTISPLTRIEGHLGVSTETEEVTENGKSYRRVVAARCAGEMYRGFEKILVGRDPLDAQQITQRICGVCPISHATASVRAQEAAYGIKPSRNGRLLQGLILAANYLQSHILHFYGLAALDFVDVTAVLKYEGADRSLRAVKGWVQSALAAKDSFAGAPLLPRYEGDYIESVDRNAALLAHYIEALDVRRVCHEMAAVFGARLPHSTAIFPGGVTEKATAERILSYRSRLKQIADFIEAVYFPDVLEVARAFAGYLDVGRGYDNFLCFGALDADPDAGHFIAPGAVVDGKWASLDPAAITEDVDFARYAEAAPAHPTQSHAQPAPSRPSAYTWVKAARYNGKPMEVGPLARLMVSLASSADSPMKREAKAVLEQLKLAPDKLNSVLGRHLARALEARLVARQAAVWLDQIEIDAPTSVAFEIPQSGSGMGLVEAPRGALGHWISIENRRIANYACVVPTTWNCSPRDGRKTPGPVEKALEGVLIRNPDQPIEVGRVVRSFDPCLACAIH
jgi:ferredoxin hydrogenase large subunit/hydrogenase large subunit